MQANQSTIKDLLNGDEKTFVIPVYQRPYSWKVENCRILLKDLIDVYEKNYKTHFFGSIVYSTVDEGSVIQYTVIDGQQRLTTVSLLLLAIRNYIKDNDLEEQVGINLSLLTTIYLIDQAENKKLKLKLVQGDDTAYDCLMDNSAPVEGNYVTINYNFFYNELSKMSPAKIKGIYEAIRKLSIVRISLDIGAGDDPQLIFESLNSTGAALDESDKIRNYVLMKLNDREQIRLYRRYWEKIEEKVTKTDVSKFLRHYLAVKTRNLANENKLYFEFKSFRESTDQGIEEILGDILKFAGYYSIIQKTTVFDGSFYSTIARIKKLEMTTVNPLLFDLFEAKEGGLLSDMDMEKAMTYIENYIVRRTICGLPAASANKTFVSIGAEIQKHIENNENEIALSFLDALIYTLTNRTGKSRFPNDHDFSEKFMTFELYNAKPSFRKYVLERLENYNNREYVSVEELIDNKQLTIEHVMPQTLSKEWKRALGENWELIYAKYIDTIGNLTLTAYNSDYSNLPFLTKRDMPEKGFKCSRLQLNNYIKNCEKWGEEQIVSRAKKLVDIAKSIWDMPKTTYNPENEEEWITMDEEVDFTNKQISKFNLFGNIVECDNLTDAYKKINELLYYLDPTIFNGIINSYYSYDRNTLRVAHNIGGKLFIELNASSQRKIEALKKMFDAANIGQEELAFLVQEKKSNHIFDIGNEETFSSLKIGKLAFLLFEHLIRKGRLLADEIEKLMNKEYSMQTFSHHLTYPVLALTRDANKGNSKTLRYYKTPVKFNNVDYYITSQWFEGSREKLIDYYNSHK